MHSVKPFIFSLCCVLFLQKTIAAPNHCNRAYASLLKLVNPSRLNWQSKAALVGLGTVATYAGAEIYSTDPHDAVTSQQMYLQNGAKWPEKYQNIFTYYQSNILTKEEFLEKIPHIAMVGDSLSKDFYISSTLSTMWRLRTRNNSDSCINTDPHDCSAVSLFERFSGRFPVQMTNFARPGAKVKEESTTMESLFKAHTLKEQVQEILAEKTFPNLSFLWIGHNNTDWVSELSEEERTSSAHIEKKLEDIKKYFYQHYSVELEKLVQGAPQDRHSSNCYNNAYHCI